MPCKCVFYKQDKEGKWICDAGDYSGNRCPILHGYKLGLKASVEKMEAIKAEIRKTMPRNHAEIAIYIIDKKSKEVK